MAISIKKLQERRAEIVTRLDAIETATENGGWTDAHRQEYDGLLAEGETIDCAYQALTGQRMPGGATDPDVLTAGHWEGAQSSSPDARPGRGIVPSMLARPGEAIDRLFGQMNDLAGWSSVAEFASVLATGRHDSRLVPAATAGIPRIGAQIGSTGVGSDGGFLVPEQMAAGVLRGIVEQSVFLQRARIFPMTATEIRVPAWDGFDASGGQLFGGFSGQWTAEGSEITAELPKLRQLILKAAKLALLSEVSNESIADATNFASELTQAMIDAGAFFVDEVLYRGTGAGQPLGVLNGGATIAVTRASGGAIGYTDIKNMFARMPGSSVPNSAWFINSDTLPQLLELTITVGTGGTVVPVLQTNGQLTLLTRPVIITEKCSQLGDKGDIAFLDMSRYAVGLRRQFEVDRSNHVGFTRDTSHFRGIMRADGRPTWPSPYTPANGTNTLSPFVVLDA